LQFPEVALLVCLGKDMAGNQNQCLQNALVKNWEVNYRGNRDDFDDHFDDVGSS
jgi:hypothetical protein